MTGLAGNSGLPVGAARRRVPVSTYRIQLQPAFGFAAAQEALDYIQDLGATDIYLSPILQAAPGSTHGYDVVDHAAVSVDLGGRAAFEALAVAAHTRGMGVVVDMVPNHMAIPTPAYHNQAFWSVLREGPAAPFAPWFDVTDWTGGILLPVLGAPLEEELAAGTLSVELLEIPGRESAGQVPVLRYHERVFPVRAGTAHLPLPELVASQHYRLAHWSVADREVNYRRFFDVDALIGLRVEDRAVFDATHALLLELFHAGHIDGFRIDHPDGLADPRGYLRWLSEETGGAWIVAEKILEGTESLPTDWPIAGTTGYDSQWQINALHVDPAGAEPLRQVQRKVTGRNLTLDQEVEGGKRMVAGSALAAEVNRLAALAATPATPPAPSPTGATPAAAIPAGLPSDSELRECFTELIIAMDRYRAYVVPGEPAPPESVAVVEAAAARAQNRLAPHLHPILSTVLDQVLGRTLTSNPELMVRFQQTCGAVMAKGVEDTAYYRWTHLVSASEVGGAPEAFAVSPADFHRFNMAMANAWPSTMTCGSTHDSKRSEDVRARIGVLSEYAPEWAELVAGLAPHLEGVDGTSANLLLQVLAGTWSEDGPISRRRLERYILKAAREQGLATSWIAPNEDHEARLIALLRTLLTEPAATQAFREFTELTAHSARAAILGTKAIQLTSLGVADVFNGTETLQSFLVDPDNRAPVDVAGLRAGLAQIRTTFPPPSAYPALTASPGSTTPLPATALPTAPALPLAAEKLALVAAVLELRSRMPESFVGRDASYLPLTSSTDHVVAFARGREPAACTIALRLPRSAPPLDEHTVELPAGTWRDIRSGGIFQGRAVAAALLAHSPAAILDRLP